MTKPLPILVILNVALAGGIIFFLTANKADQTLDEGGGNYSIRVIEKTANEQFEAGLNINAKNKKVDERKERLSARFFLPAMGERNAFTDMVDGMVTDNIRGRSPVVKSFEKLLKEENPEISEEQLNDKKKKFNEIVSDYLKKVYKIQRGLEQEGTIPEYQNEMKASLGLELDLAGARLSRLKEIETEDKAGRQIKVFEKLLIKDKDKLSEDQKNSLQEILRNQQVTIFDPIPNVDEAYNKSDNVLGQVRGVLNSDQSAHFKYFQEYHWHSYDMQELNDIPMF